MPTHLHKKTEQNTSAIASAHVTTGVPSLQLKDNRPASVEQMKVQKLIQKMPDTKVIQQQCDNPNCKDSTCNGKDCLSSKKETYDPHQTHFARRAFTKKGPPTLVLAEKFDGEHGVNSLTSNDRINDKKYREPQMQHKKDYGGTGFDEMASTATTKEYVDKLPVKDRKKAAHKLSTARVETSKLLWFTNDPDRPISAHPGGLSKSQTDMRKGLTGLHGSKDKLRAKAVKTELDNTDTTTEKGQDNAVTRAMVETTKHFMSPFEEMKQIDVSEAKNDAYHPEFGQIIDKDKGQKIEPNYSKTIESMHIERERLKRETAKKLIYEGNSTLVAPEMHESLKGNYTPQNGPNHSLATSLETDKTLDEHEQANKTLPEKKRKRAISPPRANPELYKSTNMSGEKRYKQTTITDSFPVTKKIKLKKEDDNENDTN